MSLVEEIGVLSEPNCKAVEWTITNFPSYLKKDVWLRSPDFRISSHFWYFIMIPNGKDNKGCIALYFCENEKRQPPSPPETYVDFTFGLKTVNHEIVNECNDVWHLNKDGWVGFDQFIKKSELLKKKQELMPSNSLTVTCWAHIQDTMPDVLTRFYTLSDNFKDMFTSQKNADLFIDVKGRRFSAHKFILTARCPVLLTLIEKETDKEKTNTINIPDCDPEMFHMFLSYLYTGELNFSKCNAFNLYKIATKYDMPELKLICINLMIGTLSVENFCETYVLGHNFKENTVLICTQEFFENNFNQIVSSDSWVALMEDNSQLANNLLIAMAPKIVINNGFWSP